MKHRNITLALILIFIQSICFAQNKSNNYNNKMNEYKKICKNLTHSSITLDELYSYKWKLCGGFYTVLETNALFNNNCVQFIADKNGDKKYQRGSLGGLLFYLSDTLDKEFDGTKLDNREGKYIIIQKRTGYVSENYIAKSRHNKYKNFFFTHNPYLPVNPNNIPADRGYAKVEKIIKEEKVEPFKIPLDTLLINEWDSIEPKTISIRDYEGALSIVNNSYTSHARIMLLLRANVATWIVEGDALEDRVMSSNPFYLSDTPDETFIGSKIKNREGKYLIERQSNKSVKIYKVGEVKSNEIHLYQKGLPTNNPIILKLITPIEDIDKPEPILIR